MHLLVPLHPLIVISSCLCVLACILTSLHPHFVRFICPCLHPCILISASSRVLACILASSHPHILRFILISSGSCVLVGILTSSYPRVYVWLLVCSHLQVNVFLIWINICVIVSSSSLVLGNCASQSVNNLQILWTVQAFVLDFYHTSRKIYQKQPLRADLKKSCCWNLDKILNTGKGINV